MQVTDLFRGASAVAALAGALAVQTLPSLPPVPVMLAAAVCGFAIVFASPRLRWVGIALIFAAWTMWRADTALGHRLPRSFEGADVIVTGSVRGLPHVLDESTRFDFNVESARSEDRELALVGLLRLHWYADADNAVPEVKPCSRWTLHLRLKRPRGLVNPGGFDFERYALEEDIVATGYVRSDRLNESTGMRRFCVDGLRARASENIADALGGGASADLLRALAFGDQQAMDEHEWAVARATGIPHLIAISGLHIALFAGFGAVLVRLVWKLFPRLTLRRPAPQIEAVAAVVFALAYGTIAGLGLPTRRALVMIGMLLAANLARRSHHPAQGLAFAVIALLVIDPACVLSAGFWLSFVGVAWLMFCLGGFGHARRGWRELVRAQGVASVGLLPLTIWFFGQSSLIGPLANLVAVPAICFFILPVTVAGALLQFASPALGAWPLHAAGFAMQLLWWLLERMAALPWALRYFPEPSGYALATAMLGAAWLLAPRGVPARGLGMLLFLPLLVPATDRLRDGEFDVIMLDVGQGLAVVVRTRDHALVYDAGARFPSGFDLGEAVVVPALHAIGIERLDRLVISHGDNDHAGGTEAVLAAFPMAALASGEPERLQVPAAQCLAGEHWSWDGVDFRIVHPQMPLPEKDNDRCCVVEVRSAGDAFVLTGDITSAVEGELASAIAPVGDRIVLQVPHHGSRTSSSVAFLEALQPSLALVSAGYRNRFNHPNPPILARYAAARIDVLDTLAEGFIRVRFSPSASPSVIELGRRERHPYWREQ